MTNEIPRESFEHLQDQVLALGGLVETLLIEAVDLLKRPNLDGLEQLAQAQQEIGQQRLAIETGCLHLITSERPLDGRLRCLVAMLEVATELEHVGEHARRVSRANFLTLDHALRNTHVSVHRLATQVQSLLDGALAAFAQQDVGLADAVIAQSQAAQDAYTRVYHELLVMIKTKPRIANQAIYLSRAAYHLKRAAERAISICEWVRFAVLGSMDTAPTSPLPRPARNGLVRQPFVAE